MAEQEPRGQIEIIAQNLEKLRQITRSVRARFALISVLGIAVACRSGENPRFHADNPDTFPTPNAELTLTLDDIGDEDHNGRLDIEDKRLKLKALGDGCIECADISGDGKLDDIDTGKLEYRIEHPQNYYNPSEDPNGDGKTDDRDIKFVENVIAKFGSEVPGGGIFRGGVAYIANAIEAKKLRPGTSSEELGRIAAAHGWKLERTDLLGKTATFTVPDKILEGSTLGEQIDKLETEEVVEEAGRVVIGTINGF